MKCPCCKEQEMHADGENLVCPTCGVFRESAGEFRLVANDDGSHGPAESSARQSGVSVDEPDSSGRGDAVAGGQGGESGVAKGNDGNAGGSETTGKDDPKRRRQSGEGVTIEFEVVELS